MENSEISKTIAELKRRKENKYLPLSAVAAIEKQIKTLEEAQKLLNIYNKKDADVEYGYSNDSLRESRGNNFELEYSSQGGMYLFAEPRIFYIEDGYLHFTASDKKVITSKIDWEKAFAIINKHKLNKLEDYIDLKYWGYTDIGSYGFIFRGFGVSISLSWPNIAKAPEGLNEFIDFFNSYSN